MILYVLLTGRFPFDDARVPRLLAKIKVGRHRQLPDYLSSAAKDLIRRMLAVDPARRITVTAFALACGFRQAKRTADE